MHKSNKYLFTLISLIVLFLFVAHYLRYQQDVILTQDGYQIIRIDASQTISPHAEPIVFIIESSNNEKEVYKFDGYQNGDFGKLNLYYYKPDSITLDDDFYFIEGFKHKLPFQRTLEDLSFEDMFDIVHGGISFESR